MDELVYIVDDDEAIRRSLLFLMKSQSIPAQAYANVNEFLAHYEHCKSGCCLLLDVRMPGLSGLDLQTLLKQQGSLLPIIIISGHGDIPMAVEAVKAGAVNFLEKPLNTQVLLQEIVICQERNKQRSQQKQQQVVEQSQLATLTRRERQIAILLAQGKKNKEIAEHLSICSRTVEGHRAKIRCKLQTHCLADIIRIVQNWTEFK